ncbi:hypothetical protein LAZ67_23001995 [Cordylochernes scorpioides]|uniref:DNA-directed RNA polymerases I, II, and III subunit RPABC5 n=1 Tax=Cordylochernes scorpioides TaxID=51811 RepID=A0ABY6LQZ7_9ARAC|nr:hypothetical protein LAZ67_23001995 [Cordylochernes scorpioides]
MRSETCHRTTEGPLPRGNGQSVPSSRQSLFPYLQQNPTVPIRNEGHPRPKFYQELGHSSEVSRRQPTGFLRVRKKCPMRESNPGRSGRKPNGLTSLPPTPSFIHECAHCLKIDFFFVSKSPIAQYATMRVFFCADTMLFPIRCYTCNKLTGHKWYKYKELCETVKPAQALDMLGYSRICCRRIFLGHVEIIDDLLKIEMARRCQS